MVECFLSWDSKYMFRKTLTVSNSNVVLLNESVSDNSGEKKKGGLLRDLAIYVRRRQF